ncbi:uncharacterized protein K452DRAFT_221160 [Aplosporella prunicola CBS 121167]|uniref:Trafficking protein particle complex II-specific subunit 65 IgD3 domain-containing protein n=1 Tax=Aplosporella prunicola CBS 121167 TaxID=1176127 RepID=A0A6A6BN67_9PEZI|nr:uncharacterized protein K452DRAFT_221160 [Aplosporella prunicola CBS 121167]KAF2145526.1 hypothetical protein K452DRAFT_221160 [Aplosporella prunicola CBS 121167]
MATTNFPGHARITSGDFSESSLVETIVPAASSVDINQLLDAWDGSRNEQSPSILPFVPQRQFMFFDELVPVYIVLRAPFIDESTLRSYLTRLALTLEAYATTTVPVSHQGPGHPPHAPPLKELLHAVTIENPATPELFFQKTVERERGGQLQYTFVAWKAEVFLGHPRSRLPKPVIYFSVGASLKPVQQIEAKLLDDEYLPSLVPLSGNLLDSFARDSTLEGVKPHLSASRITKVAPSAAVERELLRPLQSASRRMFRAVPALAWRIRYTKSHGPVNDLSIFASFDFEITGIAGYSLRFDKMDLGLTDGRVEPCGYQLGAGLGNIYKSGDQVALLYRLVPERGPEEYTAPVAVHALDVQIRARVLISEDCQPAVAIDWRTNVDIGAILKSKLKVPDHLLGHSPRDHSFSRSITSLGSPTSLPGPDSLPYLDAAQQEVMPPGSVEIAVTVSGPDRVYVMEPFKWDIFVVNRSDKARQLAFEVIFKQKNPGEANDIFLSRSRGLQIG